MRVRPSRLPSRSLFALCWRAAVNDAGRQTGGSAYWHLCFLLFEVLPRDCSWRWPWPRSLLRPFPVELRSRSLHAVRDVRRLVVPLVVRVLRLIACKPFNARIGATMAGPASAPGRPSDTVGRPVQHPFHHPRRLGASRHACYCSSWPKCSCTCTSCQPSDFGSSSFAHVNKCMCDRRRVGSVFPRRF